MDGGDILSMAIENKDPQLLRASLMLTNLDVTDVDVSLEIAGGMGDQWVVDELLISGLPTAHGIRHALWAASRSHPTDHPVICALASSEHLAEEDRAIAAWLQERRVSCHDARDNTKN